ncbi:MAG: 1,4-dihydroxy-2-naphthoate polyprenyltransferase [Deltaproteobacteria bacterium]|nr:1,4-dihydroxy-2-naphthoate polyprenyltransferase [Deltaproteobacteria bacterium]
MNTGSVESPAHPGALAAWWLAARPRTLTVSLVPVAVGTAVAARLGPLVVGYAVAAAATALLLQLATNWINDYADFERGADGADRLGPPRAAAQGWIAPGALRRAAGGALAAAATIGIVLVVKVDWILLIPGALAVLAAWAYTAGPWPLGYHALGDLAVFLFFGLFAVVGSAYLHTSSVSAVALGAAVVIGALATLVLAVNNLRDREQDERAGKRTLAVRMGEEPARRYAQGLIAAAYLGLGGIAVAGGGLPAALLPLLSAPLALRLVRLLRRAAGPDLNPGLAGAAQLQLVFGALLALGLLVGG